MESERRLLIVTYRAGSDIPGGAERHLWELATRLQHQEGIGCEIWTTNGLGIAPVAHWGTQLTPGFPIGEETRSDGPTVRRFPLDRWPRWSIALASKAIQRRWEREDLELDAQRFLPFGTQNPDTTVPEDDLPEFLPASGWHFPEPQPDGSVLRWTLPRFSFLRKASSPQGVLTLSGFAPRSVTLQCQKPGAFTSRASRVRSWFQVSFSLPAAPSGGEILRIECDRDFRPLFDFRTLGVMISQVTFTPDAAAQPSQMAHWEDYRGLLRRRFDDLLTTYLERCETRPEEFSRLFDWVRGPRCRALWEAIAHPDSRGVRFDGVMAANLPWAVIPRVAASCPLPLAALALWHLDDEFFFWRHYVESLRKARVVLSNTKWASEEIWPRMGVNARWAGPGVDDHWMQEPSGVDRREWRRTLGLSPEAPVVLSVSRKSAAKRYDVLVAALDRLRSTVPDATLVLVGPDEDKRPIESPGVLYVGPMNDRQLHEAYCNADAFAMMSESESFGMVFVEAWMRDLPVVANRWCRPVASLIDDGVDGFLTSGIAETADALSRLLLDRDRSKSMAAAGKVKTLRDHTWTACTRRVAEALRETVFTP